MDTFTAARLLALGAVLKPDAAYSLRQIQRWYSRTFATPLKEVEDLSDVAVLRAFYEVRYQELADDPAREPELREEMRALTESADERQDREMEEERSADENERFAMETEEEERRLEERMKRAAARKKQQIDGHLTQMARPTRDDAPALGLSDVPQAPQPGLQDVSARGHPQKTLPMVTRALSRDAELPGAGDPPTAPDVSITFVDPDEFAREIEGSGEPK